VIGFIGLPPLQLPKQDMPFFETRTNLRKYCSFAQEVKDLDEESPRWIHDLDPILWLGGGEYT